MREEFKKFLKTVHTETTLEELAKHCQTEEEWEVALKTAGLHRLNETKKIVDERWIKKALEAFAGIPAHQITIRAVQMKLRVGYHLGCQIKDYLLGERNNIDVLDLNNYLSEMISEGLKKYVVANKETAFPTTYNGADATLIETRRKEWNDRIEKLANQFELLSKVYHPAQEAIDEAFDELKRVYKDLWI